MRSSATSASARVVNSTFLQRFMLPAPKFCPTNVVQAWLKEFSRL